MESNEEKNKSQEIEAPVQQEQPGYHGENGEEQDAFLQKIAEMPEPLWKKWQIGVGVALGLITSSVLFLLQDTATFGSYNFLIAALIAIFVPRLAEKKIPRPVRIGRIAMILTLLAGVIGYSLYLYITTGFRA